MSDPNAKPTQYVLSAVARLLRPLVRLLISRGIGFDMAADVMRKTYCDVAVRDFTLPGRKQTDSRVSVLTGLTRKDVARLRELTLTSPELTATHNRTSRVMRGWVLTYPMEGTASGAAPLPLEGEERSFAYLVKRFSGDMPMRAVLDELLRVGAVRLRDDVVELVQLHYIAPPGEVNKIEYLGEDAADLIGTIVHNLNAPSEQTLFQRKAFYDNVPIEKLEEIERLVRSLAQPVVESAAQQLAAFDRDMNPEVTGSGRQRVAFGVYFAKSDYQDFQWDAPPGETSS